MFIKSMHSVAKQLDSKQNKLPHSKKKISYDRHEILKVLQ